MAPKELQEIQAKLAGLIPAATPEEGRARRHVLTAIDALGKASTALLIGSNDIDERDK